MATRFKILLLHKNNLIREKLTEYLRENNFTIIISQNVENTLSLAQSMKPDILLWGEDLSTHAKSVIKKIKSVDGAFNMPVFALVDELALYDRIEVEKSGINEILSSSPSLIDLKFRIRFHLENKRKLDRYQRHGKHMRDLSELQYNIVCQQDVHRLNELVEEFILNNYQISSLVTLVANRKTKQFDYRNIYSTKLQTLESESVLFDYKTWNQVFFQYDLTEPGRIVKAEELDFFQRLGLRSDFYFRFPVQAKQKLIGLIIIGYNAENALMPEEIHEIDLLASTLGHRIFQIRALFSGLVRPKEDTAQIRYLFQKLNENEISDYLCQQLLTNLKADTCIYLNYNEGFRFLYPQYCYRRGEQRNLFDEEKPPVLMLKDYPTLESFIHSGGNSQFYEFDGTESQDLQTLTKLAGFKYPSALLFDVKIGEETIGFFIVSQKDRLKKYTAGEIRQAEQMIQKAANVLVESRVVRQAQKTLKQLDRIFELSKELTLKNDLEVLLSTIAASIRRTLGWNIVILDKMNLYTNACENVCVLGVKDDVYESIKKKYPESVYLALKDKSFSISNSYFYDHQLSGKTNDEVVKHHFMRSLGKEWNDKDWVLIPVRSRGQELGCIMVNDPVERLRPTVDKIKSLEYFANQAAVALENATLYQNLKSSELRYRLLAETMTMGLVTCDFKGRIEYGNTSLSNLLKMASVKQFLNKNIFTLCSPKTKNDLENAVAYLKRGDVADEEDEMKSRVHEGIEVELTATDGELVPLRIFLTDYYRHSEKAGFLAVLSDLRPQRRIERLKADFNSMIVHDLRSPLNIIQGYIDIVRTQVVGKISNEQAELLLIAKENVDKVLKLIDNFLTASKLEAGKFSIKTEVNSLNALIEAIYEHHLILAKKKEIELKHDLDARMSLMEFDKIRIEQVITNYVSNALKFTKKNGTITIRSLLTEEKNKLTGENMPVVQVSVTDTGVGIPIEEQAKVFSKYEQTEAGKDASLKGTGLGLAICKEIVSLHNGRVWLESQQEKGSTFYFSIPYTPVEI
ncbi:MAG: hypothetical protein JXR46_08370 [Calditrichaceae bacterium]|nr:hypothetical protein [Calditrichaceae bacterium]